MSKASERKKARRKKRRAERDARWIPADAYDELPGIPQARLAPRNIEEVILGVGHSLEDDYPDEIVDLVQRANLFDRRITKRGWTFDSEFAAYGFASWFYRASGIEPEDENTEAVTRIWLTATDTDALEDDENFPNSVNVILVGSDEAAEADCKISPDELFEHIEAIESYRTGDPRLVLCDYS